MAMILVSSPGQYSTGMFGEGFKIARHSVADLRDVQHPEASQ